MNTFLVGCCFFVCLISVGAAESYHLYTGTYTTGDAQGIYHHSFHAESGELGPAQLVMENVHHPSFLAVHPNGKVLYAVGESRKGKGGIFTIENDGGLSAVQSEALLSGGCHISVDNSGKYVAVTTGKGFVLYALAEDGSIEHTVDRVTHTWPHRWRKGPMVHAVYFNTISSHLLAVDMACEQVPVYEIQHNGVKLVGPPFISPVIESGPRHAAFHTSGSYCYVLNELSGTIDILWYDQETGGTVYLNSVNAFHQAAEKEWAAEIQMHPTLPFVYASIRGHGSLAVLRVREKGADLQLEQEIEGIGTARHFIIDPSGRWLLTAASDKVSVYAINQINGDLKLQASQASPKVQCVVLAPIK